MHLAKRALALAERAWAPGGKLLVKLLQREVFDRIIEDAGNYYPKVVDQRAESRAKLQT